VAEIEEIIEGFGAAAGRAQVAGFDAVQVHAAHAYLISQFLSPHTNRRTDGWGGSPEARFRFLKQLYRDMRRHVGPDYPIHIKLGVADGFAGGLEFTEGKAIAAHCVDLGFDMVEVSQGLRGGSYAEAEFRTGIPDKTPEAYFRGWTRTIRRQTRAPVVLVGGLRSIDVIRDALDEGDADLAALCRPLIREPGLINRWGRGDDRPSRCVSCNQCYEVLFKGLPLHCVVEARGAKNEARCG
jgi:2,4-dienoyl-CoA reductase-like NADH-dependent reductase (Old Yellow Enzyme family)